MEGFQEKVDDKGKVLEVHMYMWVCKYKALGRIADHSGHLGRFCRGALDPAQLRQLDAGADADFLIASDPIVTLVASPRPRPWDDPAFTAGIAAVDQSRRPRYVAR